MKMKTSLAICTASLFMSFPLAAQSTANHGNGNGNGNGNGHGNGDGHGHHPNNSNHGGHDDDGNSAGHRQDRPHGFGDRNLVLPSGTPVAAVAGAMTSVTSELKSGSMRSTRGATISEAAQARTYSLLSADPTRSTSAAEISFALSTAGPEASARVPDLVQSFAALKSDPAQLPSVVEQFNGFTKVASNSFIASPPPEFVALHSVLARLVSAATTTK